MKTKGALFYLQAEISGNYTTIAAMQSNSMTINQETVEITDKSMLFRELLENAGIGSVKWEQTSINTITIDTAVFGDVYKDKYDTSHSVGYGKAYEMAEWIAEQLTKFWNKHNT